ncbi:MAG TPA: TonB-dependent receptor, partial [Oceanicaulis sp.]|nr:TonB-dependent receptor [Oceanicaulis sp.]
VGGDALYPADPEERVAFANREYDQIVEDWGVSAEFDIELPIGTLTTVTSYRNWENARSQDIDYTSADLAYRDRENNFTNIERLSQEVRLNGQWGDLDWLVGAFYSHED